MTRGWRGQDDSAGDSDGQLERHVTVDGERAEALLAEMTIEEKASHL